MAIVSLRLPEPLLQAITEQAQLRKISRSKLVREILEAYLKGLDAK